MVILISIKKILTIDVLGPVGDVVSEWIIKGAFIKDASFGDMNWDDDTTVMNISLTLRNGLLCIKFLKKNNIFYI